MRTMRLVSAAATTALLAAALVGCSEAEDAVNDAKDQAASAGESAMDDAASAAEEGASELASDASDMAAGGGKGDGGAGESNGDGGGTVVTVDYGEFEGDPAATAAGDFFTVRQAAIAAGGDTSELSAVATPAHEPAVTSYVEKHAGETGPVTVAITAVDGGSVDVCVGARPRTLTVEGDKVADNTKGRHACG